MGTRREVRERLVELFDTGDFTRVYGYAPLDLRGATKVLCIYSDRTRHEMLSKHLNNNFYAFFLEVFVRRNLEEDSEADLDDLHEVVREVTRENVSDATWETLNLETESDALFAEVKGVPYRVERHVLGVKVTQ